jgi:hypothetical protein
LQIKDLISMFHLNERQRLRSGPFEAGLAVCSTRLVGNEFRDRIAQAELAAFHEGAWYRLSADHYEAFDTVTTECPAGKKSSLPSKGVHSSGRVIHSADTLVFLIHDDRLQADVVTDRGFLRGDTLQTGGILTGDAPRVYVRREL